MRYGSRFTRATTLPALARHALALPALAAGALLAGAGCAGGVGPEGGPDVVATIPPLASMAGYLLGSADRVLTLLPPGANPDTYEPTPRVAEALAGAAVVLRIGGPVDGWVGAPTGSAQRVVAVTEGLELISDDDAGHDDPASSADRPADRPRDEHSHEGGNPHVWLDPILVRDRLIPRMTDALAESFPDSATAIRARAAEYADSLTALDAAIRESLSAVRSGRFVAAHAAWAYFARRYDLEQVGVVHKSPGREVSARELARIVDAARSSGAAAVIAEPQLGRAGVEALAGELRIPVAVADPLGGAGMEGRESYLDLMRFNARAFARGLTGRSSP